MDDRNLDDAAERDEGKDEAGAGERDEAGVEARDEDDQVGGGEKGEEKDGGVGRGAERDAGRDARSVAWGDWSSARKLNFVHT